MKRIGQFIRLSRLLFLVGAALVYFLGVGIARYLGANINWGVYLLGQAWVTILQLGAHYLNEYFDAPADAENPNRTPFSGGSGAVGPDKIPRQVVLFAAITCLAIVASLTVLLINQAHPSGAAFLLMVLIFLGAFFYSVPPIRLVSTGYGELTTTILVANLVPALAFVLQADSFHNLVAMTTFPLTMLHLSMMLAFELPDYSTDLKMEKRTMMVRLGWRNGMALHNLLIFTAFLLLGLAAVLGFPLAIVLPAFLPLPLGILQIWQMRKIADGAKPNWLGLTLTPVVIFGSMAYLLAFAFWTR